MCHHAGFRWGGSRGAGTRSQLGSARRQCGRAALFCGLCSVGLFCVFAFFCIVVVPLPFVRCSVKLPLSRPTSFCLFLSILLCTPEWGGAAMWFFCCRLQPNRSRLQSDSFLWCQKKPKKGTRRVLCSCLSLFFVYLPCCKVSYGFLVSNPSSQAYLCISTDAV